MYNIYQIQSGDTIEKIASKYQTTQDDLFRLNGMNDATPIVPGNYLVVPAIENEAFTSYTVKKGDNPYEIAKQFGIDFEELLTLNGLELDDYIYPDQELLVPKPGTQVYITKEGDTLEQVSNRLKVEPMDLLLQNKQLILIPDQLILYKKERNN